MNWDAIGSIGEVLGAIAVVLTLIYLSVQLRRNTTATLGDRLNGHFDTVSEWYRQLTDAEVAGIWLRGVRDYRGLFPAGDSGGSWSGRIDSQPFVLPHDRLPVKRHSTWC